MNGHVPVKEQSQKPTEKLRGHYGYFGITGNFRSLRNYREGDASGSGNVICLGVAEASR